MYKHLKILGLILARGGSKGVPRKNIRLLGGKPLIAYSILRARESRYIDRIIVSSDDFAIRRVAGKYGAETPFIRPKNLAGDLTPDYPVIRHCLDWLRREERYEPDIIVFLRPTGPFRTARQIDEAIKLLAGHPKADCVRSFSEACATPYRMWTLGNPYMKPILKLRGQAEPYMLPRQILPKVYQTNPNIHVMWRAVVTEKKSAIGKNILPVVTQGHAVDIDSKLDFEIAELFLKKRRGKE